MEKAAAFANNDVAMIAWSYDDIPIHGCLGFAVYRVPDGGVREPLPAWVGWKGLNNPDWKPKTTRTWPVQKFWWRDLTAERDKKYTYEIVPRTGTPGHLESLEDRKLVTNPVTLSPRRTDSVRAYFNRGILSTQSLARDLPKGSDGKPDGGSLVTHIKKKGDSIRNRLAGQLVDGVAELLRRVEQDGGQCFCALYELNDPELVPLLTDPQHVVLVLSNAGSSDDPDATNRKAREDLTAAHVPITNRMLKSGHIGHNKFIVYVDGGGTPRSVLTGSTNWTYTGVCAQSNNAILIDDSDLASAYLTYWNRIKGQSLTDPATQDAGYRDLNNEGHSFSVDGNPVRLWVSPNTKQQSKPKNPPRPKDLEEVFDVIDHASQGILFLLFQPGSPSVLNAILDRQEEKPELFVRGAATDPYAINEYSTDLFHRLGQRDHVAAASAIQDQFAFWDAELLKTPGGHAIIHDKIVVVDPFSDSCAVITGSHNLGYRASYNNDDNLLILRGNRSLAEAYAVHVMDVYDHYRWRWLLNKYRGNPKFTGIERNDGWQEKYFGLPQIQAELAFWL